MREAFDQSMEREEKPSTGVSSEIERRRVIADLEGISASLRALRERRAFWKWLKPAAREHYEDMQIVLYALTADWRK